MEKIKIMISSTVVDLEGERDSVKDAFKDIEFVELLGVDPVNTASLAGNARSLTKSMANECDLYLLIIGKEFGFELPSGKSATEIEFDAAFRNDPTKILVFKKEFDSSSTIDKRQQKFIDKVCDYYSGYWRSSFKYTHELRNLVLNSFMIWLKERANIGNSLDYLDHFVRIAKQMKPEPNAVVYYKLAKDFVELEYNFFGTSHIIQFDREEIYKDFWGCISKLQEQFEQWL
ncbi:DUF4062 domain-containing protein [Clostridium diolis]|uniref:DUF4062 domain-containing protein n=1 Tax=Clostridium diolis TaxID=223919 RepID=UPI003AF8E8F8